VNVSVTILCGQRNCYAEIDNLLTSVTRNSSGQFMTGQFMSVTFADSL